MTTSSENRELGAAILASALIRNVPSGGLPIPEAVKTYREVIWGKRGPTSSVTEARPVVRQTAAGLGGVTGIALSCIGSTTAFGAVVRKR